MPIEFKDLARMRTTWDYLKDMAQQNQGRLLGRVAAGEQAAPTPGARVGLCSPSAGGSACVRARVSCPSACCRAMSLRVTLKSGLWTSESSGIWL